MKVSCLTSICWSTFGIKSRVFVAGEIVFKKVFRISIEGYTWSNIRSKSDGPWLGLMTS